MKFFLLHVSVIFVSLLDEAENLEFIGKITYWGDEVFNSYLYEVGKDCFLTRVN